MRLLIAMMYPPILMRMLESDELYTLQEKYKRYQELKNIKGPRSKEYLDTKSFMNDFVYSHPLLPKVQTAALEIMNELCAFFLQSDGCTADVISVDDIVVNGASDAVLKQAQENMLNKGFELVAM